MRTLVFGVLVFAASFARADLDFSTQVMPWAKQCYDTVVTDLITERDLRMGDFQIMPNPEVEKNLNPYTHVDEHGVSVMLFKVNLGLGESPIFYAMYFTENGGFHCKLMKKAPTIH